MPIPRFCGQRRRAGCLRCRIDGTVNVIDTVATTHAVVKGWAAVSRSAARPQAGRDDLRLLRGLDHGFEDPGRARFARSTVGASWSGPVKTNAASTIGTSKPRRCGETARRSSPRTHGLHQRLSRRQRAAPSTTPSTFAAGTTSRLPSTPRASRNSRSGRTRRASPATSTDSRCDGRADRRSCRSLRRYRRATTAGHEPRAARAGRWRQHLHGLARCEARDDRGARRRQGPPQVRNPHRRAPNQLALAVEPDGGKLWVVWTQGKYLWATRLRDAAHGSAPIVVRTPLPAGRTAYALEAVGLPAAFGPIVNISGASATRSGGTS